MARPRKKGAVQRRGRERPPNLRQADTQEHRACSGCLHFGDNYCARWAWPVKPFHVCDTWAEKVVERTPDQERRDQANAVLAGVKNVTISVDPGGAGA